MQGEEPVLPSVHALATYAGLSMFGAATLAVAFDRACGGAGQDLSVDLGYAALGLNPERLFGPRLNHKPYGGVGIVDNPFLRAPYRTGDGAYIMLSALYPQMAQDMATFFALSEPSQADVAQAVGTWDGLALEDALTTAGLAATLCRTQKAWSRHPQGRVLADTPLIDWHKRGDAPQKPRHASSRPLEGIRVLSLGRALAGPIIGRTLAEQGADVLGVSYPRHFEHEAVWCEANVGHRSCSLDVGCAPDRQVLDALLAQADVVINNHQSPRLQALGLDGDTLLARYPGLVHVSVSAFGTRGPWSGRLGFDMNASAATGMMCAEGANDAPRLPVSHLAHDVVAGYLGALGVTACLHKQLQVGGSYDVQLSLARCAMWCQSLGPQPREVRATDHADWMPTIGYPRLTATTALGHLERMHPVVGFSRTAGRWREPILVTRGSSAPSWLV